jgi:hypothetical protein
MKPKASLLRIFLIGILAVASVLLAAVTVGLLLFAAGTSVGTEKDVQGGMKVGGICLLIISSIPLGWIVYGLRGGWRIVSAAPFALLACLGMVWITTG